MQSWLHVEMENETEYIHRNETQRSAGRSHRSAADNSRRHACRSFTDGLAGWLAG